MSCEKVIKLKDSRCQCERKWQRVGTWPIKMSCVDYFDSAMRAFEDINATVERQSMSVREEMAAYWDMGDQNVDSAMRALEDISATVHRLKK